MSNCTPSTPCGNVTNRVALLLFVVGVFLGGSVMAALLPPFLGHAEPDMRPTVAQLHATATAWARAAGLPLESAVCRPDGRCAIVAGGRPMVAFCDVLGCDLECAEVSAK